MARKSEKSKSKKSGGYKIPDLSKVTVRKVIPKGWYSARIEDVESGEGEKGDYFKWAIAINEGKYDGVRAKPFYTSLNPEALFNLKMLLEAVGFKIPAKGFSLEPTELVGEELFVLIDHEIYEGKKQSVIVEMSNTMPDKESDEDSDDDSDEDSDEEDDDDSDDAEEEEDVTEDDIMEMDQEELEEYVESNELDVDLDDIKSLSKMRKKVVSLAKKAKLI